MSKTTYVEALLIPPSSSSASLRSLSVEVSKSGNEPLGVAGHDFVISELDPFRPLNDVNSAGRCEQFLQTPEKIKFFCQKKKIKMLSFKKEKSGDIHQQ